jgi:hypothetical protein
MTLNTGDVKRGEAVSISWPLIKATQWYPTAFAQTDLTRVAHHLRRGSLFQPTRGVVGKLPLIQLDALGTRGATRQQNRRHPPAPTRRSPRPSFFRPNTAKITRQIGNPRHQGRAGA